MGLALKVLGNFEIRDAAGSPLSVPTRKTRALLGYLAVYADKPQQRDRLMSLLWGDRSDKQARHSLSQALLALRKLGFEHGVKLLETTGDQVTLSSDAIDIDLARFRAYQADDPAKAVSFYGGPLLDGFTIPDPAFEEWLWATRPQLHDLACNALERAADAAVVEGDIREAIELLRRLVELDLLREESHRRLMRLLYASGDRSGALRQYQTCAIILKRELQVEPGAETKAVFDEIGTGSTELEGATPLDAFRREIEKPTIAALPFSNLGDEPSQELLCEGMADDIITGLSRFHSVNVIARSSSFVFKNQEHNVRKTAHALGARYLLEGSIRRSGAKLRVTAQLVDADSGKEVWSERYDRELDDIFTLQDEITEAIIASIEPAIGYRERERVRRMRPSSMDAWALYQQGLSHYYHGTSTAELQKALRSFEDAVQADPGFAAAHAMRAESMVRILIFTHNAPEERNAMLREALASARTAIRLDPEDSIALVALGWVNIVLEDTTGAMAATDKALKLNPLLAPAFDVRGWALASVGEYAEALDSLCVAEKLSPNHPYSGGVLTRQSICLFALERYEEAVEIASRAMQGPNRGIYAAAVRAASLKELGRDEEAKAAVNELMSRAPNFTVSMFRVTCGYLPREYVDRMEKLLRAVAVPE